MGKPYSLDLRDRICAYVARGHSARAAGRVFGVGAATAVRFAAEHREGGDIAAKPQGRPSGRFGKLAAHLDFLPDIVRAERDITPKEPAAALSEAEGVQVQLPSLHRAPERPGVRHPCRDPTGPGDGPGRVQPVVHCPAVDTQYR